MGPVEPPMTTTRSQPKSPVKGTVSRVILEILLGTAHPPTMRRDASWAGARPYGSRSGGRCSHSVSVNDSSRMRWTAQHDAIG